jgi:hypothetical protein
MTLQKPYPELFIGNKVWCPIVSLIGFGTWFFNSSVEPYARCSS